MLSGILQNMLHMLASQTNLVHTDFIALKLMSNELNIGWGNELNTLREFADVILKWIFLNENILILINLWLKFVPNVPINNKPALVQVMAWCWIGDKPLSEPIRA